MKAKLVIYIVAVVSLLPGTGEGQEAAGKVPPQATVNGNYSGLFRILEVPKDEILYGKFSDRGYYPETDYAGYKDLKPGYWVYVAPNWYIWKNSKKPREPEPTIDGPERKDIVGRITGYVLIARGGNEIVALSLPSMRESLVRRTSPDNADFRPTVHAISGPDTEGRIAYIEDYFFVPKQSDQKHLLKIINLDGTADTTIFSRPGNAMWATSAAGHGEIGTYLALAPSGGKVALLSHVKGKQMPRAHLNVGKVEIWDVARKSLLAVTTDALDEPMSWFPHGERLAYVKLVPRNQLPKPALGQDEFGKYGGQSWDEVPAVYVLDAQTGASTFLHVGWTPVVSSDGKTVLVGGWSDRMEFTWRRVNISTGQSRPVGWPGNARGAVAASAENIVLYWGLPTSGALIQHTRHNSPLRGPKLMLTLKIAVIGTHEFQTVVPAIDPRSRVSFGRPIRKGQTP